MIKKTLIKSSLLLFLAGVSISFTSCKKEGCTDSAATNYDSEAKKDDSTCEYPPVVLVCISDDFNGTYNGSGTLSLVPSSNMTVVFTKLSCVTCTIESGSVTENVTGVEESSDGAYVGTDSDGNSVSFSLDGNDISISTDEIDFSGNK